VSIGVILKLHKRIWTLSSVFRQLREMHARWGVHVVALMDRPTLEVATYARGEVWSLPMTFINLDFEVVGLAGEQFARADNLALEVFEGIRPDWVYMQDDDRWFEPGYEAELSELFGAQRYDVAYVRSLFFWEPHKVRLDFFTHCSPALWRWQPSIRYPLDRNLWTPAPLVDAARANGRAIILRSRFCDWGYSTPEERERVAHAFFSAGKIDLVTTALLEPARQLIDYDKIKDNKEIPNASL